jgi:hypothetical protein
MALEGLAILCGVVLIPLGAPTVANAALDCSVRLDRDLNGDGFADTVVGDPYATVGGQVEAGAVTILYGDADGRIGGGSRQTLTQADIDGEPEAGDHFGWDVAINRTLTGGCPGILIGSPGEDVGGQLDAGMASVITSRPDENGADELLKETVLQSDMGGTVEAGDEFGFSVAAIGGRDEEPVTFAYGAPGENQDSGVVNLYGSFFGGLPVQVRQGSGGVPGKPQDGDRFGQTIALEYTDIGTPNRADEDSVQTLLIGAPGDNVAGKNDAGSVTAIRESFQDVTVVTQNSTGIGGSAEAGDRFGTSIAVSSRALGSVEVLLAIGVPGEDVGRVKDAGSVNVLRNTRHKLVDRITLSQSTKGIIGTAEKGDNFGQAVAFRDDRALVIGIPGEDVGTKVDAGSAHIVRIGATKISTPYPTITEDSPGTAGEVATNSRFGTSVAGFQARPGTDAEVAFAVSSPFQDGGSVYVVSDAYPARSWVPTAGVRFGQSVG